MAEGAGEAPNTWRWLAWAAAALLALGVASAGMVNRGRSDSGGVVAAAGRAGSTVAVATSTSTTTTVRAPVTSTPPSTVARSTPPKAAAAVLAAIGSTTTITTPPSTTTTTRPPVTTTPPPVAAPSTSSTTSTSTSSTTPTTVRPRATVTIANELTRTFVVVLNGRTFEVAGNQQSEAIDLLLAPNGADTIEVRDPADATCGLVDDKGGFFQAGGRYRLALVTSPGSCTPQLRVTPA